jgi:ketosteroid isomerase-like protein
VRLRKVAALALLAACGPGHRTVSDAERRDVAAAVDSATRAFEAAERARDAEGVVAHLAPEFYMYVDGVRAGYDSVVAGIRRGLPTYKHFEPGFDDVEVIVLGRDAAVASFTFHDSIVTASGETQRLRGPTTLVWVRRDGDWRIAYADADHYAPSP